jgi:uncharacterized protein (DUF433 family)
MAEPDSETPTAEGVPHIVETADVLGGDSRIEGTRIGVGHVYQRYVDGGDSPEAVAASYELSVAAVHAALAYAFGNPRQMREIEVQNRAAYEQADRLTTEDV